MKHLERINFENVLAAIVLVHLAIAPSWLGFALACLLLAHAHAKAGYSYLQTQKQISDQNRVNQLEQEIKRLDQAINFRNLGR